METATDAKNDTPEPEALPPNRFELELEFLQSLASPAYIHYLSTSEDDLVSLQPFLRYLRDTWTKPEYVRFVQYPDCLYFLDMLIENPRCLKEWTLPAYRNFCHQQQFLAWQHRHATCYGVGKFEEPKAAGEESQGAEDKKTESS